MMTDLIKISVVVPVYNVEMFIRTCLDSLAGQTYHNIEIILVDDGSQDQSGSIIDEFAENKHNVISLHQPNSGVSLARNLGLSHATGEYILFVDPDDWIELDCCARLAEVVQMKPYDIVFFMDRTINEKTGDSSEFARGNNRELCIEDIQVLQYSNMCAEYRSTGFHSGTPWGKLFRKSFLTENSFRFTAGVVKAQDVLFCTQCYEAVRLAYCLDYVGYNYRLMSEGSSNVRYNPKIVDGTRLLLEGLGSVADLHYDDCRYRKAMGRACLKRINFMERLYLFHEKSVVSKDEIIKIYKSYLAIPAVIKYLPFYENDKSDSLGDIIRGVLLKNGKVNMYYKLVSLRYQ